MIGAVQYLLLLHVCSSKKRLHDGWPLSALPGHQLEDSRVGEVPQPCGLQSHVAISDSPLRLTMSRVTAMTTAANRWSIACRVLMEGPWMMVLCDVG